MIGDLYVPSSTGTFVNTTSLNGRMPTTHDSSQITQSVSILEDSDGHTLCGLKIWRFSLPARVPVQSSRFLAVRHDFLSFKLHHHIIVNKIYLKEDPSHISLCIKTVGTLQPSTIRRHRHVGQSRLLSQLFDAHSSSSTATLASDWRSCLMLSPDPAALAEFRRFESVN